jgi:hypothetical protein
MIGRTHNFDTYGFSWPGGPDYVDPNDRLPPRCARCGAFLSREVDRLEQRETYLDCDGSETLEQAPYDESLIAILGEEFRGKTYTVSYSPCGLDIGQHEPHRELQAAWDELYRHCRRCGYDSMEVDG